MKPQFKQEFAMEDIMHQHNTKFGAELEVALTKLRQYDLITKEIFNNIGINEIIKKYTGLSTVSYMVSDLDMFSLLPNINKNSPILVGRDISNYNNEAALPLLGRKGFIDGTVNLKTGMVTGDFAKHINVLAVGYVFMGKGSIFTVAESVALLLHEIGHLFVYFEMLARYSRTNYILAEGIKRLTATTTVEQRIILLNEIEDCYDTIIPEKDKLTIDIKGKDIYTAVILSAASVESEHELGINIYDSRAYEQLADNYAARMGYGRSLAQMLYKCNKLSVGIKPQSPLVSLLTVLLIMFMSMPLGTAIVAIIGLIVLRSNPLERTYDPPKKRILKIKHQIIDALKEHNISAIRKEELLNDLKTIDTLYNETDDSSVGIIEYLYKKVLPKGRRQDSLIKMEEELENLYNNDLFAVAAKLKSHTQNKDSDNDTIK